MAKPSRRAFPGAWRSTVIANFASFYPTNERGVALFEMLLRRYSAAVVDLESLAACLDHGSPQPLFYGSETVTRRA